MFYNLRLRPLIAKVSSVGGVMKRFNHFHNGLLHSTVLANLCCLGAALSEHHLLCRFQRQLTRSRQRRHHRATMMHGNFSEAFTASCCALKPGVPVTRRLCSQALEVWVSSRHK
jgi:hypothetical protein